MNTHGTTPASPETDHIRIAGTNSGTAPDLASRDVRAHSIDARTLCLAFIVALVVFLTSNANAALRDYTVKWLPSGSPGVERYVLSVGQSSGSYSEEFDLGLPDAAGGQMKYVMELEGSVDLYLSLRAVNTAELYSGYSNEIVLAQVEPPPPSPEDFGVASIEGLGAVTTGAASVTATAQGVAESVLFLVDGEQVRVDSEPPYTLSGSPGNLYETSLLSDGDHTLTAVAFSEDSGAGVQGGALSMAFFVENTPILPPPPGGGGGGPGGGDLVMPAIVGLVAAANGEISLVDLEGGVTETYVDQISASGDLRPAWCDLNGDEQADLVVGFGPGSEGKLLVLQMQDHQVVSARVLKFVDHYVKGQRRIAKKYARDNGETYPSCGDIDGDGLAEIVVGLGHEGGARLLVLDDVNTDFERIPIEKLANEGGANPIMWGGMHWRRVGLNATLIPAVGDVDGDGLDEIVLGRGPGAGERLAIFDDAQHGFKALRAELYSPGPALEVPGYETLGADGSAWPAVGDIDGDGRDEILVGLGEGGGGRLFVFDDAQTDFEQIANDETPDGAFMAGDEAYRESNGQLIPSAADIDADGRDEVAVGFGIGADERVQVLDDLEQGLAPYSGTVGLDGMVDPQLGVMQTPALHP